MTASQDKTRSVVVERELPHPPEKIWRALTEPHLIEEWLMKNDFAPTLDRRFDLVADWGAVACRVTAIEPHRTLAYTWDTRDLKSVVTWSLTPIQGGTLLRMEQTGFRPEQENYYRGATMRWPRFIAALARIVARGVSVCDPSHEDDTKEEPA